MSTYVPAALRRRVREHFRGLCAYCLSAERLTVVTFEIEHITPQVAGGETHFENLCLAYPSCNRHKATRQRAIDPETGQEVALYHPQRDVWGEHFVWLEEGAVLEGLTPEGRATIHALEMNRAQLVRVRRLWIKLGEHPPNLTP